MVDGTAVVGTVAGIEVGAAAGVDGAGVPRLVGAGVLLGVGVRVGAIRTSTRRVRVVAGYVSEPGVTATGCRVALGAAGNPRKRTIQ